MLLFQYNKPHRTGLTRIIVETACYVFRFFDSRAHRARFYHPTDRENLSACNNISFQINV